MILINTVISKPDNGPDHVPAPFSTISRAHSLRPKPSPSDKNKGYFICRPI